MPTISVDKAALFKELGREYVLSDEFDFWCFVLIAVSQVYH